jgi:hypothetical protein
MPSSVTSELKGRVLSLRALNFSYSMIVKTLEEQGQKISKSAVSAVLKNANNGVERPSVNGSTEKKQRRPTVRTVTNIKKVKGYVSLDNLPTQRDMARRLGISVASISNIIHRDLDLHKRMKPKVHHLTERAIAQRKERALHFYNLINSDKLEYILTMDEAMLPLDFQNGQRMFYYESNNPDKRRSVEPLASKSPGFPVQRMFAAGFSWRGPTKLYIVPSNTKVNSEVFIKQILEPMVTVDIPRPYGRDAKKVWLHLDSATSHTAKSTRDWLDAHGVKYFTKEEWLANSPELSPMDFFANGYFKSQLRKRNYKTLKGMLKAANEEWRKIPLEMFQKALRSWPKRVLAIHKAQGRHAVKKRKQKNKK